MNVLLWLGIVLSAVSVVAICLRTVGLARWVELVRAHSRVLESSSFGAHGRPPSTARFDAHELDGLPPPVQRYFRAVLKDGQPIIAAATMEMAGTMNMSASTEQWKAFTSSQRVVTRKPGFLWNAQVQLFPGVPVLVEDSYIAGQGRLIAKVLGLFAVADSHGEGEIARGEFMRYFAEAAWYPTALLSSQGVRWEAVDDASAKATIADGPITLTLLFRFDEAGLIASVRAESRGAGLGKDGLMTMLPWDCAVSNYQTQNGMLVPMAGEAAWIGPSGRKVYFVGQVRRLRYTFTP